MKGGDRSVILIYHTIGESKWAVSKNNFSKQMQWLSENAVVDPLPNLLDRSQHQGLKVYITFDDGYQSVYQIAEPIMQKYGFTATVYLNTGWIDDTCNKVSDALLGHYPNETFMNWFQVRELAKSGWNIGSHGVEHDDLTKLRPEEIRSELEQSKLHIEKRINKNCNGFSYTWGFYNAAVCSLVRECGYVTGVSGEHGAIKENVNFFTLPRIDIRNEYSIQDFQSVVSGRWDYLRYIQKYRNAKN